MTGKAKRDDFTTEETPDRSFVLMLMVDKNIVMRGDVVVDKQDGIDLSKRLQLAYHELAHDGLVHGEYITGRGHAAAVAWGLIK